MHQALQPEPTQPRQPATPFMPMSPCARLRFLRLRARPRAPLLLPALDSPDHIYLALSSPNSRPSKATHSSPSRMSRVVRSTIAAYSTSSTSPAEMHKDAKARRLHTKVSDLLWDPHGRWQGAARTTPPVHKDKHAINAFKKAISRRTPPSVLLPVR